MSDLPPAEGSADKPFVENPYTALLKSVGWGGGFMAGVNLRIAGVSDVNAVLLRGAKSWTEAKTLSGGRTLYDNRAGAYGNPRSTSTFLFGGQATVYGGSSPGFLYLAWIEATTDGGQTWTRTYEAEQSYVAALVYDKTDEVFYAQATANADGGTHYVWQVLKSEDGMSWAVVETTAGAGNQY